MTKKEKLALVKKGVELLEPVLAEEKAPAARRLRRAALQKTAQTLPELPSPAKLKRLGLLAGGTLLGLNLVGGALRMQSYRRALSHELKKQLKPVNAKLEALEKENAELREELKKRG
ncbi:MAG: hypothetical protein K6G17_01150 [Oscillospiraceae bacterium]|nr:hypothetical protein [Oscillospiraceae bacterium]